MCDVFRIQEPLLTNIKKLVIPPINIIDLFPMMKSGLSTKSSVFELTGMFDKIDWEKENGLVDGWFDRRLLIDELRDKVLEEETIMEAIVKITGILKKLHYDATIFNIAIGIYGASLRVDFDLHFKVHIHNKIIELFLQHPKIDPLYISSSQKNVVLVNKFLNNPRSNKLFVYGKYLRMGEINEIIATDIILRIFLYKEYFSPLPKDLYTYFMELEIF